MEQRIHRFEHGNILGTVIEVLEPAQWDLNRMLPESLQLPASDAIVTYTYSCALLPMGKRLALVDAGFHSAQILDTLALLGIAPQDITHVFITHGDGDHVGGLLTESDTLTFPHAHFILSEPLRKHWQNDASLNAMPEENQRFFRTLAKLLKGRATTFIEESEFEQGIRLIPCPGHRHGHAVYEFPTRTSPIMHFGDTLFHPLFAENTDWPDTMALDPQQEVASRKRMLERAAKSEALVLTGHIPFPGLGTIHRHGASYQWQSDLEQARREQ